MTKDQSIFLLEMHTFYNEVHERKEEAEALNQEPEPFDPYEEGLEIGVACKGFFKTMEEAECAIPEFIKRYGHEDVYCFYICELPLGICIYTTDDTYSVRVYDHEGRKLDERLFPSCLFAPCRRSVYYGRKPEEIRFHPGDVVEYRGRLHVIHSFMRPYEEGAEPRGDSTDDGYTAWVVDELADNITYDKAGSINLAHCHPSALDVFSPRFPITPTMQRRIDNICAALHLKHD